MKKKIIAALSLSALVAAALPMTAFAHGHHYYGGSSAGRTYSLCSVEDCNTVGYHQHSGVTYLGHYYGDGHDYHQVCSVEDCTLTGSHDHNGTTCLPHNGNDGHSYHWGGHH